jgi:hypothetical protein
MDRDENTERLASAFDFAGIGHAHAAVFLSGSDQPVPCKATWYAAVDRSQAAGKSSLLVEIDANREKERVATPVRGRELPIPEQQSWNRKKVPKGESASLVWNEGIPVLQRRITAVVTHYFNKTTTSPATTAAQPSRAWSTCRTS